MLLHSRAQDLADEAQRDKEQKEQREWMARGLEQMGDPCRQVLKLRSEEGASYIEIGRRLKVPIGTVMSRLGALARRA